MPRTRSRSSKNNTTANLGFEAKLVCDEVTAIFVTIIKRARERLSSNVRMQELPPSSFFLRTSSSPRGNANFAWVQHFIIHPCAFTLPPSSPMATCPRIKAAKALTN
jgi:hypothetical protein